MVVLALEGSTSAAKAMLLDGDEADFYTLNYPPDVADGLTIDPQRAFELLMECGGRLVRREGAVPDVVALSSVWHGLLAVDGDVNPVGRYHTWADTAAAPAVEARRQDAAHMDAIYRRTGCPPHSSFTFWKLMHLRDKGETPHGAITLGEYFFYRLTGGRRQTTTSAAGTGLLNLHTRLWDAEQLALCGLSEERLFTLCEPGYAEAILPDMARRLGVPVGTPVTASMPDGGLNQIASGGLRDGLLTLSVGTSGAVRLSLPEPKLSDGRQTWCYYGAEDRYIAGGAVSGAGNLVQWFLKEVAPPGYTLEGLEAMLTGGNFAHAPVFLPFRYGERSPGWRDVRPHGFRGERPAHTVADRYYAVLEGVLMNLYQSYEPLRAMCAGDDLVGDLSGGILGSPYWAQMAADLFDMPFTLNPGVHASILGAAQVGLKAIGGRQSFVDIPPTQGRVVTPDMERHRALMQRYVHYLDYYGGNL